MGRMSLLYSIGSVRFRSTTGIGGNSSFLSSARMETAKTRSERAASRRMEVSSEGGLNFRQEGAADDAVQHRLKTEDQSEEFGQDYRINTIPNPILFYPRKSLF